MQFKLRYPINLGKVTIESLNFREHTTAEDYLAFDQRGGVAQRIALIASMAGQDESLIKRLHGADYQRAVAEVDRLMEQDDLENVADQAAQGDESALLDLKEKAKAGDAAAIKALAELDTKKK